MRIKKAQKRVAHTHPAVRDLVLNIESAQDHDLSSILSKVEDWQWPRTDLQQWINVLNRFDSYLESVCNDYIHNDIQINEFTPQTKKLVIEILRFTRLLLENSTNRKIFMSVDRLDSLLCTRDIDVLEYALLLAVRHVRHYSFSHRSYAIGIQRLLPLAQPWMLSKDSALDLSSIVSDDNSSIPSSCGDVSFQFYQKPIVSSSSSPSSQQHHQHQHPHHSSAKGESKDNTGSSMAAAPSTPGGGGSTSLQTPTRPKKDKNKGQHLHPQTPHHHHHGHSSGSGSGSDTSGLINLKFDAVRNDDRDPAIIVADSLDKNRVPLTVRHDLLQKLRIAKNIFDPIQRRRLLCIRLNALTVLIHSSDERTLQSKIFNYESNLINQLTDLIHPDHDIPIDVQCAALNTLYSISKLRNKANEVWTAINLSVNHGVLLYVVRRTILDVENGGVRSDPQFIECLFGFINNLLNVGPSGTLLVGSGIIPLFVDLVKKAHPAQLSLAFRAVYFLDNAAYFYAGASTTFFGADGVNIWVSRIKDIVDNGVKNYATSNNNDQDQQDEDDTSMQTDQDNSSNNNNDEDELSSRKYPFYGYLPQQEFSLLKHLFRSLSRMMQTTGISDSFRNLIDSSLPHSIKQIFDNQRIFGHQIFSLAISVMTTLIHNEPTSLTILQENHIPESLIGAINEKIVPSNEVLQAMANALGALCLNEAGLQYVKSSDIITRLLTTFVSIPHARLLAERDKASSIGMAIDEFMRHHSSLKPQVFDAIDKMIDKVKETAARLDSKYPTSQGKLVAIPATESSPSAANNDVDMQDPSTSSSSAAPPETSAEDEPPKDKGKEKEKASSSSSPSSTTSEASKYEEKCNTICLLIDITCRFLDSVCQNITHNKEFVSTRLAHLISLLSLRCLPADFVTGNAAKSMASLLGLFGEYAPGQVLQIFMETLRKLLDEKPDMWNSFDGELRLLQMSIAEPQNVDEANDRYYWLLHMCNITSYLENVFPKVAYTAGRGNATAALQTLNSEVGKSTMADLGALNRICIWEAGKLKKIMEDANKDSSDPDPQSILATATQFTEASKIYSSSKQSNDTPREKNTNLLRQVANRIPVAIHQFLNCIIARPPSRRLPDSSHRKESIAIAETISQMLIRNLKGPVNVDAESQLDYGILVLSAVSELLLKERHAISTKSMVIACFEEGGGIDEIIQRYNVFRQIANENSGARDTKTSKQVLLRMQAYGGTRLANVIFERLVSFKAFPELTSKRSVENESAERSPEEVLVSMRSKIFPVVVSAWSESWITDAPVHVVRQIFRIIVSTLIAEGESRSEWPSSNTGQGGSLFSSFVPLRHQHQQQHQQQQEPAPDEGQIQQLMDMGFPRTAAITALRRSNNQIQAAANYLILNPGVVNHARDRESSENQPQNTSTTNTDGDSNNDNNDNNNNTTTTNDGNDNDNETNNDEGNNRRTDDDNNNNNDSQGTLDPNTDDQEGVINGETTESSAQAARNGNEIFLSDSMGNEIILDFADPELGASSSSGAPLERSIADESADNDSTLPRTSASDTSTTANADQKKLEEMTKALDEARNVAMKGFFERALNLVKTFPELVFEIKTAFKRISNTRYPQFIPDSISHLLSVIESRLSTAQDNEALSSELRLLALLWNDNSSSDKIKSNEEERIRVIVNTMVKDCINNLKPSAESKAQELPSWITPLLLVIEALLSLSTAPSSVGNGSSSSSIVPVGEEALTGVLTGPSYEEEQMTWFDLCTLLLSREDKDKNVSFAALRILIIITRKPEISQLLIKNEKVSQLLGLCTRGMVNPKSKAKERIDGGQDYAIFLLRHIVESRSVLDNVQESDIKSELNRNPLSKCKPDIFWHSLKNIALRDPQSFLQVSNKLAILQDPDSPNSEIALKKEFRKGPESSLEKKAGEGEAESNEMQIDEPSSSSNNRKHGVSQNPNVDNVIHYLMSEILSLFGKIQTYKPPTTPPQDSSEKDKGKAAEASSPAKPGPSSSSTLPGRAGSSSASGPNATTPGSNPAEDSTKREAAKAAIKKHEELIDMVIALQYNMIFLVELLYSYPACRASFMTFHKRKGVEDNAQKSKSYFLNFLMSEVIPFSTLPNVLQIAAEAMDAARIKDWTFQIFTVLCVHTTPESPSGSAIQSKDVPADTLTTRKLILDIIARTFKDVCSNTHETAIARNARFTTLGQLCYWLLCPPLQVAERRQIASGELPNYIAQTMLEKNFPMVFTSALAELDLNYPEIEKVAIDILKPLACLARLVTKVSKGSQSDRKSFTPGPLQYDPDTEVDDEDEEIDSDEDVDDEMDHDDQEEDDHHDNETSNLYRNSALGMFGGELGPRDEDVGSDEDGFEEYDDEYDVDMMSDYSDASESDATSDTVSEDEGEFDEEGHDEFDGMEVEEDDDGGDDIEQGDTDDDVSGDEDEDEATDIILENDDDDNPWQNDSLERMVDALSGEVEDGHTDRNRIEFDSLQYGADHDEEDSNGEREDEIEDGASETDDHEEGLQRHDIQELQDIAQEFQNNRSNNQPLGELESLITAILSQAGNRSQISYTTSAAPPVPTGSGARQDRAPSNTHPLLVDNVQDNVAGREAWESTHATTGSTRDGRHPRTHIHGGDPLSIFDQLFDHVTGQRDEPHHWEFIQGGVPESETRSILSLPTPRSRSSPSSSGDNNAEEAEFVRGEIRNRKPFVPITTNARWGQELQMTEGPISVEKRTVNLGNHLTNVLIPSSRKAKEIADAEEKKKKEEEEQKRKEEEEKKKAEEEEKERKKKEEEEKKKAEEEAARAAEESVATAAAAAAATASSSGNNDNDTDMAIDDEPGQQQPAAGEDVQMATDDTNNAAQTAASSAQPEQQEEPQQDTSGDNNDSERVLVTINGREVDITSTGIDPSFLEALPDEMREEVLEQHYHETGQTRPSGLAQNAPATINADFLSALPPQLRAEVIENERMEEMRRGGDSNGEDRAVDASSMGAGPMDDEPFPVFGFSGPHHATGGGSGRRLQTARFSGSRGGYRGSGITRRSLGHHHHKKEVSSGDAVQILDKSGLAVLVRLLFSPVASTSDNTLQKVLVNLSANDPTRIELVTLLLGTLQKRRLPQVLITPGKSLTTDSTPRKHNASSNVTNEPMPHVIAQRCLEMLLNIVTNDEKAPCWFFTEQETSLNRHKGASARKGKAKEKPTKVYPIVVLFELLENEDIVQSPDMLDSLTRLLGSISRVLPTMSEEQEKQKNKKDEKKDDQQQKQTEQSATSSS